MLAFSGDFLKQARYKQRLRQWNEMWDGKGQAASVYFYSCWGAQFVWKKDNNNGILLSCEGHCNWVYCNHLSLSGYTRQNITTWTIQLPISDKSKCLMVIVFFSH